MSSDWRDEPSSLNWTPATAMLSDAVADILMVPNCVEPVVGVVIDTVGGVVSGGPVLNAAVSPA